MRHLLAIFICGSVLAANTATVGTLNVGGGMTGGGGGWTPTVPELDHFGTGVDEVELEFVTVAGSANPAKTGTLYQSTYGYDPGAVSETFRIMKYELSYGEARRLKALFGLPITIQPAVTGVADEDDRPCSKVLPIEGMLLANAMNVYHGYHEAYNITGDFPDYQFDVWPAEDSYVETGITNRFLHKDAFYRLPSIHQYFKAAQWDPVNLVWLNYGQGSASAPTPINGLYGGSTASGTSVVSQRLDERYPEYNYFTTGKNVISVDVTAAGGQISAVAFNSRLSGYTITNDTTTAFAVVQAGGSSGTVTVDSYNAVRVPAQWEIVAVGTGYNSDSAELTEAPGTVTLSGATVTVSVFAKGGAVVGIYPTGGTWNSEDTTTVVDIVQAGGSGATCKALRYVDVYVPAAFTVVNQGSGYSTDTATVTTTQQPNIWQDDQPWQGAAPVQMAGGLSPYGVMALDGNVHEYTDSPHDGVYEMDSGTRLLFFSSYWNTSAWESGFVTEYKPPEETITSSDSTFESGLRFAAKPLP